MDRQMDGQLTLLHWDHPNWHSFSANFFNCAEEQTVTDLQQFLDSCAKHFATQFPTTIPTPDAQRDGTTCSIIWQGNPISAVKTFATKNCALCATERTAVLKQFKLNPQLLINSNNEICGACRHRPKFHVCGKPTTPSTDESINDERVNSTQVATDFNRCHVCLSDFWLEALWGPTQSEHFLFVPFAMALETIPTNCYKSVTLRCLVWIVGIVSKTSDLLHFPCQTGIQWLMHVPNFGPTKNSFDLEPNFSKCVSCFVHLSGQGILQDWDFFKWGKIKKGKGWWIKCKKM